LYVVEVGLLIHYSFIDYIDCKEFNTMKIQKEFKFMPKWLFKFSKEFMS